MLHRTVAPWPCSNNHTWSVFFQMRHINVGNATPMASDRFSGTTLSLSPMDATISRYACYPFSLQQIYDLGGETVCQGQCPQQREALVWRLGSWPWPSGSAQRSGAIAPTCGARSAQQKQGSLQRRNVHWIYQSEVSSQTLCSPLQIRGLLLCPQEAHRARRPPALVFCHFQRRGSPTQLASLSGLKHIG